MAVTVAGTTFSQLYITAQPFGYDEQDVNRGQTAKQWSIEGLLDAAGYLDLLDIYDTWRDLRIDDPDPVTANDIGTTVAFSGNGPGGVVWTDVDCWFNAAPTAEQTGQWLKVTFVLVDAAQKLEILQRGQESVDELRPDFGTYTIGTTTLVLTKPLQSYGQGPQVELTAGGVSWISGPLVVYKINDVEGETNVTGWNNICSWYESQIIQIPTAGAYYPISIPTATAERKIVNGVLSDVYTVSIALGLIL